MYVCRLFTKSGVLLNKLLSQHVDPVRDIVKLFLINFQIMDKKNRNQLFRTITPEKHEIMFFL